jgi:peptidoglycan hydrolase-like protein with peptidoglycan-binding domain
MGLAWVVYRAQTGWPYNSVPYSQSGIFNDDDGPGPHIGLYRRDCSGFGTMAGKGPTAGGGYSTVTMLTSGWVRAITWAELDAGDFVGALGEGTAGDAGHVMVVESVNRAGNTYTVLEQAGYGPGPDRNTYRIGDGQGRNYKPYRLSNTEEPNMTPAQIAPGAPFPLSGDNVYGDINGPDNVHGGYYAAEQPVIAAIQRALVARGFAGNVDPADWADGLYEQPTIDAVRALQTAAVLPVTGNVDAATWAALFPAVTPPPPPPPPAPATAIDWHSVAGHLEAIAQIFRSV